MFTTKKVEQKQDILNSQPEIAKCIMIYTSKLKPTKIILECTLWRRTYNGRANWNTKIFFCTDSHWIDLFRHLQPNCNPTKLADLEQRQLIQNDPLLTGDFC